MNQPSPNGTNGRDRNGKFTPGNRVGKGNPFAAECARLRSAMIQAVSDDDVSTIIKAVVAKARNGDLAAAALVLDRVLGRPAPHDLATRIDRLEQIAEERYGQS
jgi:hypothetical protein